MALTQQAKADDPLAARTLVVYATNSAESIAVKDHYVAARFAVPAGAPVCPITLPDISANEMSEAVYNASIRNPIRTCLNTVGKTNILYIVLAYIRPYRLTVAGIQEYYSIDSYLADIWDQYAANPLTPYGISNHRYYADAQSQGNVFQPYISLAAYRLQPRSVLLYSVWRLDGATPAIANGLIDKAVANQNAVTGAVCIDRNLGDLTFQPDVLNVQADFDLHSAASFFAQAGLNVIEDPNYEEFGTAPAPLKCPADGSPVAFYSGLYSLNNYNGASVFNWAPGAVGFHIDSASLFDPRGGTNWGANALLNGITVTSGAVYEPYYEGLPRASGVFRNLLEGANVGDAFLRNTRYLKWKITNVGDPLYRPFAASGKAPFNPPAPVNSLGIANRLLVGGFNATGTITIAAPAPAGGTTFNLASNAPAIAAVPATATVPAGLTTVSFPITTTVVSGGYETPLITATAGSVSLINSMLVVPLLGGVSTSANFVTGGTTIIGTVLLNNSAPAGGITVALLSTDTSAATVPASVFVPAGVGRVTFPINTSVVGVNKATDIKATYNATTVSTTLTVIP